MKCRRGLPLLLCLLLGGCGGEEMPAERETAQEAHPMERVEEESPEQIPEKPTFEDWRKAYVALLEEKAERVAYLRDFERPDYDPGAVGAEIDAVSGQYRLYDVDKDGVPELLFTHSSGNYTDFYGFQDGRAAKLGEVYTGNASFYHWPKQNAVALNWAKMGGHTVTKLSIVDGVLAEEMVFEENVTAQASYTDMADIVSGSCYLWENRTYVELPELRALTLPIADYGTARMVQTLDTERDTLAKEKIEEALNGSGKFYGVSADGFGGDTGWTKLADYLAPKGVSEYNDFPMEIRETQWLDLNGDGQNEALVTIVAAAADDYEDTKQVIFSYEEDGVVYAYCKNHMGFYDLAGTTFAGKYDMEDFAVAFDGPQIYFDGVKKE